MDRIDQELCELKASGHPGWEQEWSITKVKQALIRREVS